MAVTKKSLLGSSPATAKTAHTKSSVAPAAPVNATKALAASRVTALKAAATRVGVSKAAAPTGMVTAKRFRAAVTRTGF